MTLWHTRTHVSLPQLARFTIAEDRDLDRILLPYDICGSQAHVRGLARVGVLTKQEARTLHAELEQIGIRAKRGARIITERDEDGHSALERILTARLGAVGRKVHTGRSRNDQSLTALRLYLRAELASIRVETRSLITALRAAGRRHARLPMPGYTHMQRAMPSTVSRWCNAFADEWSDTLTLLGAAERILDQSPLGSVVGYGEHGLGLDRRYTARILGFSHVQRNPLYAANSRGAFEYLALVSLAPLMLSVGRFASDLLLFSTKEYGFVSLPEKFTTGSSAMPQKRNYDVLELLRARSAEFGGVTDTVFRIMEKLPSGYNRDVQRTKKYCIDGLKIVRDSIGVAQLVAAHVSFDKTALLHAMTPELYATEEAYALVRKGVPFRDAYFAVAKKYRAPKASV